MLRHRHVANVAGRDTRASEAFASARGEERGSQVSLNTVRVVGVRGKSDDEPLSFSHVLSALYLLASARFLVSRPRHFFQFHSHRRAGSNRGSFRRGGVRPGLVGGKRGSRTSEQRACQEAGGRVRVPKERGDFPGISIVCVRRVYECVESCPSHVLVARWYLDAGRYLRQTGNSCAALTGQSLATPSNPMHYASVLSLLCAHDVGRCE